MAKSRKTCDVCYCISRFVRLLIVILFIFNFIYGSMEVVLAMVVNFLVGHPAGSDGFTYSQGFLQIRDITYIEHQSWELPENIHFIDNDESKQQLRTLRNYAIGNCSEKSVKATDHTDKCEKLISSSKEGNYFCAIVEHPERYRSAVRRFISHWLIHATIYLVSIPLLILSMVWTSQTMTLMLIYMGIQLIPMGISISIVHDLWKAYALELCGMDYFQDGLSFQVRPTATWLVIMRLSLKTFEIALIAFCVWEIIDEKSKKGFGINTKNRKRVDPRGTLEIAFRDEILQPYRPRPSASKDNPRQPKIKKPEISNIRKESYKPRLSMKPVYELASEHLSLVDETTEDVESESDISFSTNPNTRQASAFPSEISSNIYG